MTDDEYSFNESVLMVIGALTEAEQYWNSPTAGTDKIAIGNLNQAKNMIEETIEEHEDDTNE